MMEKSFGQLVADVAAAEASLAKAWLLHELYTQAVAAGAGDLFRNSTEATSKASVEEAVAARDLAVAELDKSIALNWISLHAARPDTPGGEEP